MRKYKGLFLSVSMAAMLMASGAAVYADETEATETVTEAAEAQSDAEGEASATEAAQEAAEVGEDGILVSDRTALESYAQQSIEMIVNMTAEEAEEVLNPSSILSNVQDSVAASVQSWLDVKEELGEYLGVLEHDIEVTDDSITIKSLCDFSSGENTVTTTLDRDSLTMESISFGLAEKSFGEKMQEAVLNTLMGVGIVFLMLFFLTFLISQFKKIGQLEEAFKKKNAPAAPAAAPAPVAAAPVQEEETVDDGELIAVIAAAIAAAEGTTTDGFVVRSIKKSTRNRRQRA